MALMPKKQSTKPKFRVALRHTLFNNELLAANPLELRDDVFGSLRENDADDDLRLVNLLISLENILNDIELQAKKILKANPPPFEDHLVYLDDIDLTEEHFWNLFGSRRDIFTLQQANAIAALRSVQRIRKKCHAVFENGYYWLDPRSVHTYDPLEVAEIAMEMALLITAAIRGDFWSTYWPHIEGSVLRVAALRTNSSKAVEARRVKTEQRRQLCRDLARDDLARGTTIRASAKRIGSLIRREKMLSEPPSIGTIREDIKDLFVTRVKKKQSQHTT
jgi:hypothetical protein